MTRIKFEAIGYLRRHLEYPIPKPVERASVEELLVMASASGHRQMCACTILKCMHIIHHLEGRELLFVLPLSDQEVFHVVEEKVYRVIGGMLAGGFPITEFVGGRKNKDSLYTKLLSKQETIAAQIYDKLRFRIVTRSKDDIFPIMQYLSQQPLPVQLRHPRAEHQLDLPLQALRSSEPPLKPMLGEMQTQGRRRRLHAERQHVHGGGVPHHPLHRGHAGSPPPAHPRPCAGVGRAPRVASSSSSASSRSSTATRRPPTSTARPRTIATRSGSGRPSCGGFSSACGR